MEQIDVITITIKYILPKNPKLTKNFLANSVVVPAALYSKKPIKKSISAILPVTNKVKKHKTIVAKYLIKNVLKILLTFKVSIN